MGSEDDVSERHPTRVHNRPCSDGCVLVGVHGSTGPAVEVIPTRRELCPSRLPTKSLLLHWMPALRQSRAIDSNEGVGPTQREFSAPSRGNVEIVSGSCPHDPPADLLDCLEQDLNGEGEILGLHGRRVVLVPQDSDATPRSIQDVSAESLEPNTAVMGPSR